MRGLNRPLRMMLVVLVTVLLSACDGPSIQGAASSAQNRTRSLNNVAAATTNTTAGQTQARSSTNSAASRWPKVGSWPKVTVRETGRLPQALFGNALAIGPNGDPVSVGGYTGVASLTSVYQIGTVVKDVATLPARTHDAAVGLLGNDLLMLGGGQANSYNTIVGISHGQARVVGHLSRPLSDATSVPLTVNGQSGLALVGGYDGAVYRTTVAFVQLSKTRQRVWSTLFTMPIQARYVGVASSGSTLYMAGGKKPLGLSDAVYAWSPNKTVRRVATLPHSLEKAALFVAGPYLFVVGGEGANGVPTNQVIGVDTRNGSVKMLAQLPVALADMGYVGTSTGGILAGGVTTSSDRSATRSIYTLTYQKNG